MRCGGADGSRAGRRPPAGPPPASQVMDLMNEIIREKEAINPKTGKPYVITASVVSHWMADHNLTT